VADTEIARAATTRSRTRLEAMVMDVASSLSLLAMPDVASCGCGKDADGRVGLYRQTP
jgi:hypothetical protein